MIGGRRCPGPRNCAASTSGGAKLLGLDAPTKLDVRGLNRTGTYEISAERQARRAVLEALPIEERLLLWPATFVILTIGLRAKCVAPGCGVERRSMLLLVHSPSDNAASRIGGKSAIRLPNAGLAATRFP